MKQKATHVIVTKIGGVDHYAFNVSFDFRNRMKMSLVTDISKARLFHPEDATRRIEKLEPVPGRVYNVEPYAPAEVKA